MNLIFENIDIVFRYIGYLSSVIALILFFKKLIKYYNGNVSWQNLENKIENLAHEIKKDEFVPDILIGVSKGGSIVSGIFSVKYKSTPILHMTVEKTYRKNGNRDGFSITFNDEDIVEGKKVLLIVGENKTGQILTEAQSKLKGMSPKDFRTAAIVSRPKEDVNFYPDYVSIISNKKVTLPWDD